MATSILIAKLIGPILLVAAVVMLANPKDIQEVGREFLKSRALIYLAGVLAMLGGLAIVISHNIWVMDWPVIITVFGWASIIGGIIRIALPQVVQSMGAAMIDNMTVLRVSGAVWLLIAALLVYKGYFS